MSRKQRMYAGSSRRRDTYAGNNASEIHIYHKRKIYFITPVSTNVGNKKFEKSDFESPAEKHTLMTHSIFLSVSRQTISSTSIFVPLRARCEATSPYSCNFSRSSANIANVLFSSRFSRSVFKCVRRQNVKNWNSVARISDNVTRIIEHIYWSNDRSVANLLKKRWK